MGLIYLDSCLLIYLVEAHPRFGGSLERAMEGEEAEFGISPLVKLECLVDPIRRGNAALERAYQERFDSFRTLELPESVFLLAAELRARLGLKTPDAMHLACAQHHGCDALWTNDDRLARPSRGMARNVFAD